MRSNRRVDTKPEVKLRSLLHRRGLRFRKDYLIRLPNRRRVYVDVAFTKKKVAVFVDGCFWHSCPQHGTMPKSNQDYWIPKLRQNVERDRDVNWRLREVGWSVIRIWEHESLEEATATILTHLE
ncbi:MAG: very short patch repair endonuclease [Dehalococcoidia bacterium]|nr:very short patch repair endonuclease [Dehalococcoidia bacterium]